ncbi:MAG: ATP-binding cassette domain-containing protein [Parabacteroides sp.]|uniref:ATP-binding cassette domain-containing protein n=1 Tax=Parabacteroides faecalis TaxID=2924040 RepID=A0ABT0C5Z6_9BACT|nr:ATP-binding cassette domain-containing protein [Parabacteroides faecalis]MCI7286887.1 ATP-binding cassette domain-containing protein [Parabacteroides sp.]MDY6256162.1 ATP-binding cassette domain-containing protein [Bacteroidales bacterium]MCJ2382419.1 ATP-binding cassette domain-containing protein [Parabacteroides faecalis]MDD6950278.1 ATP-binding cassette domain-containing protein [Parabacteroides sp.]MDD7560665.1 ATP-binding cassette domain-containing protein [Parabacteroides sp.]
MKRIVLTCLSILLIPVAWQLLSWQMAQPQLIPSFPDLIRALLRLVYTPGFLVSIGTTCLRACVGLLLSLAAAAITAFLLNRSEGIRLLFMPWLSLLRSVPVISFILLALIFLNPEMIPLLIAFLTMYPLLTENLLKGLMNRRDSWKILARQFHLNAWNRLFQINYPQLKPYLFSGLASAVGFGWRAIIMGEVLSQCVDGIGKRMKEAQVFIDVPELIAWTLVAIVLSWLTDKLISRLSDWQPSVRYRHSAVELQTVSLQPNDICLTDVSYSYGVHHMNIILKAGKIYVLSAPSGQGKTTLLQLLNGTLRPISGEISCLPGQTANLFQEPTLLPQLTAKENIMLGGAAYYDRAILEQQSLRLLVAFQLEKQAEMYPAALSYGQQQRVALARALMFPAGLLLLDEPFNGLDVELRQLVARFLVEWQQEKQATVVFSSHHADEIKAMNAEVITL